MAAANYNLTVVAGRILKLLDSEEEHIAQNEMLMGLKEIIEEHALVLLDAENKCLQEDEDVYCWMMKLEDALCDAENLVDELTSTGNVMAINHFIRNCFISPHTPKMSNNKEVNRVRRRLEQLAFEGRDFHLDKLSEKQVGTMKPDINHAAVVQEDLFLYKEDDKAAILKFVSNPHQSDLVNVEVLPILDMGGIGKTALAKEVFNDEMVRDHFELRIWVSVGIFDVKEILTTILVRATNRAIEDLEFEVVANALKGKLYLIVLDGAWRVHTKEWDELRNILRVGAHGSKIIVTTRNEEVAKITGTMAAYSLNMPSEEQSWLLFRKMAFKEEEEEPSERSYQKEIGREIVKMCRRNPLVIKMLGSLLRTSSSEEEWRSFYHELQAVRNGELFELMKLCYKHLPSTLKHCFTYCSLFPKDQEYDVQTVIKLWMSQGFIIESLTGQDQSPEDAGYDYVLELLRRGFFQVSQIDTRDRVIKFQIHHLLPNFPKMVAWGPPRLPYRRNCHVSINKDFVDNVDFQEIEARTMRSMAVPFESLHKEERIRGNQLLDITVSRFIFIRTLDMHGLGINRVPSSITNLKLLKYLDLSENEDITELPHSITKLLNLQTLKLSSCYGLKRLPRRGFENLINLRHLEIDGCYNLTSLPRGIHQLTNLQILSQLAVSDQGTSPNIGFNAFTKEVDIKNLGHEKFDMSRYLNDVVSGVQSLSLQWESNAPESNEHKTPLQSELLLALKELTLLGFRGNILFSANCPINLVKLSLRKCVNCRSLPALEGLWNLKVLVLDELIKLEYISENEKATPFFPSLKELWLTELPKLQSWWRNEVMNVDVLPSFPCLSKLVIEDCPKLTSIPLFPTLEEGLALDSTCWKPFQLTLNRKTAPQEASSSSSSSSSPSSLPLSNLKALRIVGIENFDGNKIEWRTLKSLEFLRFDCLPKLVSLPEGLQHVVSLQEFQLWRCGTEEIPEWIGKLHSLSKLMICLCHRLKSLPESIRELKLLKTLEVEECDTLLRRCEKEIGADWEKICLIKNLRLGGIASHASFLDSPIGCLVLL
ncbi:hypothetical protein F8388_016808 [Cannabis sativa]|uniref:Uncharacterized protein n=1 Tax=Cannabis sativa TaxID=3483 RepID=A0A7J6ETK5_CANSA|nr:hypothetical protein F8388_016808 [Cannabis sativa]